MATKKIPDVPCWNRRFVDEVEMIAMLNATRHQWERFKMDNPGRVKPNNFGQYDRQRIEDIWAKQ